MRRRKASPTAASRKALEVLYRGGHSYNFKNQLVEVQSTVQSYHKVLVRLFRNPLNKSIEEGYNLAKQLYQAAHADTPNVAAGITGRFLPPMAYLGRTYPNSDINGHIQEILNHQEPGAAKWAEVPDYQVWNQLSGSSRATSVTSEFLDTFLKWEANHLALLEAVKSSKVALRQPLLVLKHPDDFTELFGQPIGAVIQSCLNNRQSAERLPEKVQQFSTAYEPHIFKMQEQLVDNLLSAGLFR